MDKPTYTLASSTRFNRLWLRLFFRGLFHILGKVRVTGKENVPANGPYIVAINHISLFDPPFVVAFWPTALEAVGAVEIWEKPGQGALARWYGGIQVHRGEYDRQLIETILAALHSGYSLLIAPEGGRSHKPGMQRGKAGLAYIVDKTGVPVIPVGIFGSTDDFLDQALHAKHPPLEMRIGKPIYLPPLTGKGPERHASLQRNVDQIMIAIASLLPPDYRGVYADFDPASRQSS
jgi:1-acyl-sn-glycerol-3-phosphate acyltransferase